MLVSFIFAKETILKMACWLALESEPELKYTEMYLLAASTTLWEEKSELAQSRHFIIDWLLQECVYVLVRNFPARLR